MFWEIFGYTVLALILVVGFVITAFIFCFLVDRLQRRGGQ